MRKVNENDGKQTPVTFTPAVQPNVQTEEEKLTVQLKDTSGQLEKVPMTPENGQQQRYPSCQRRAPDRFNLYLNQNI